MKKRWILLALLLLALLPHGALAEDNLIKNGGFEESADSAMPAYWSRDAWVTTTGASEFALIDDGYDGVSIMIRNNLPNDARLVQRVAVQPDSCYQIRCMVRAEDVGEGASGACISIENTFSDSEYVYDTGSGWRELVLTGYTGEDQTELAVMARLGGYSSLNTGTAWFDNFSMVKLENEVLEEDLVSFETQSPQGENMADDGAEGGSTGLGTTALLLLGALYVLLAALYLLMTRRGRLNLNMRDDGGWRPLAIVLGLALGLRLLISVLVRGYGVDMSCFESWSARLAQLGPSSFYAPRDVYFCDYPPGYLYVLWAIGALRNLLQIVADSRLDWLMLKLPSMLLDIVAAGLLYKLFRKSIGNTTAMMISALYAFNPAAILNSAAWGQIDAVLALLMMLTIWFAMEDKWHFSLPVYALAILMKPQALMFAPLALIVYGYELHRAWGRDRRVFRNMLLSLLSMAAVIVLLSVPFVRNLHPGLAPDAGAFRPLVFLFEQYRGTVANGYEYITVNACNLYTLLDMNWENLENVPRLMIVFSYVMMGLSALYALALYIKSGDRRKLPLACALMLALWFCFGPMMHERYLFPALLLLLVAYAVDLDIRLLVGFLLLSFAQFVNVGLVLQSEHLQSSQQILNAAISLLNIWGAGVLCWAGYDLCCRGNAMVLTRVYHSGAERPSADLLARRVQFGESIFRPRDFRLSLRPRDMLLMVLLTALYAALAFNNLGTNLAPQTSWTSSAEGEQVTFDLGEIRDFHMAYYGGICDTTFKVQMSDDGEAWSKEYYAEYKEGLLFRWLWYQPMVENPDTLELTVANPNDKYPDEYPLSSARYIRLTMASRGMVLYEVAFLDADGNALPIKSLRSTGEGDAKALFDEQDTVPAYPSYLNGTYFDEIYHARTGYEHLHGLHTYEWTHPPLGKLLIALGIKLFGMTPFGWRFMGTLFGALMVPLMYLIAKQLTKRTSLAFIASFLMAVDCMHFTQTRIATIDSFAVFFILLMYLFMLRYFQMSFFQQKLWRTLVPLGLCGITMGLAIATKWIGIYAALGLAFLLFFSLVTRYREYRYVRRYASEIDAVRKPRAARIQKQFNKNTWITLTFCAVFFVAVPALIYYFSYYWQLTPDGNFSPQGVWNLQKSILNYHAGLGGDTHLFRSPWYEWLLIIRPMWYFDGGSFLPTNMTSSISAMGNPVVWWGGLISVVFVFVRLFIGSRHDRRYVFVTAAFLSQILPWILVPRSTFIYHYFASVPFIILATALLFDWIRRQSAFAFKLTATLVCVVALALFWVFYPVISGTPMPRWYAQKTQWFGWINYDYYHDDYMPS